MIYTTLNKIFSISPSEDTREYLLRSFGKKMADDEPLSLEDLIKDKPLDFILDCCQLFPEFDSHWRLYAVWCAKQCPWIKYYEAGLLAISVAERFAKGEVTLEEFRKAQDSMAGNFNLDDRAPGKTAAGTTHEVASLGAKITALSVIRSISHYEGLKAVNETPSTGDIYGDDMESYGIYDKGKSKGFDLANKALKEEFSRLLRRLN